MLRVKKKLSRAAAKAETLRLFEAVHLREPHLIYEQYVHEPSGGMLQRVLIAAAIALGPDILIADEATTALDVTAYRLGALPARAGLDGDQRLDVVRAATCVCTAKSAVPRSARRTRPERTSHRTSYSSVRRKEPETDGFEALMASTSYPPTAVQSPGAWHDIGG